MANSNPFLNHSSTDETLYRLPQLPESRPAAAPAQPAADAADVDVSPARAAATSNAAPTRADVIRRALAHDVDPRLALSLFSQESSGNWNSRDSNKGAVGGMQVMPDTYFEVMGTREGMRNPWNNLEAGLRYLAKGQKILGTRDPALLAAGYHSGFHRDSLKRGEIPNVSDGAKNTRDYAREVAGRVNGADGKVTARADQVDLTEGGRFEPLAPDEATQFTPSKADDDQFEPITADMATKLGLPPLEPLPKSPDTPARGVMGAITDLGKNLKVGADVAAQDMRELVGRIPGIGQPIVKGADAVDRYFHPDVKDSGDLLKKDAEQMTKQMTPEMRGALQKKWWDSEKGTFGPAWSDWRAYAGGVTQSLPEQALTMVPAMRLAKAAYASKIAAGASEAAAAQSAARAAQITGMVGEGLLGGAQSSREVRDKVMELPQAVLDQSEAYQSLIQSGMQPDEARIALANDLSTRAFVTSGAVTGLFGGMGDRALAKIFTEKAGKSVIAGKLKAIGKGALSEGLFEELPQSVGQQLAQNEAIKQANPQQDLMDDVINQGLGGMALGAAQGGGMAGLAHGRGHVEQPKDEQPAPQPAPGPSAAPGPMTRAAENAAGSDAQRVTVTAPDGSAVQGQMQAYQETPDGGFTAQVVGDDGQVYTISDKDGVSIQAQEPPAGPLTGAAQAVAETQPERAEQPSQPEAPEVAVPPAEAQADVPAAEAPVQPPVKEPTKARPKVEADLTAMSMGDLRARLKYIASQAKDSGWNTMLMAERKRIEREINKRADEDAKAKEAVAQAAVPADGTYSDRADANPAMLAAAETTGKPHEVVEQGGTFTIQPIQESANESAGMDAGPGRGSGNRNAVLNGSADGQRTGADGHSSASGRADAGAAGSEAAITAAGAGKSADTQPALSQEARPARVPASLKLPRELAGAKPRYAFGNKQFDLNFASDIDRAAYIAAQKTPSKRDADYVKFVADATGMTEAQVREHGARVRQSIKEMAKDAEPGGLAVPAVHGAEQQAAPAQPQAEVPAARGTTEAGIPASAAAVKDDHAGKWFGSQEKADAYLAKRGIGDTHEVVQTGKVRFEIKPKAVEVTTEQPAPTKKVSPESPQAEPANQDQSAKPKEQPNARTVQPQPEAQAAPAVPAADAAPAVGGPVAAGVEEKPAEVEKPAEPQAAAAPPDKNAIFKDNKIFTADAVEKARARLRSKLTQLNSGIDPEIMMDGIVISGAYIEAGVRKFADFAKAMVDDLGPKIKPFLLSFYEGARHYPGLDTEGMTSPAAAKKAHDAMLADMAEPQNSPTLEGKEARNDAQSTEENTGTGAEGQATKPVRRDAGGRNAGRNAEPADGKRGSVDRGGEATGDLFGDDAGNAGLRGRSDAAPADAQQPVQGGRGNRAESGDRGDRQPERAKSSVSNYRIAQGELTRDGSWKKTAERNVGIVELVKTITAEGRQATPEERAELVKFTGWGASEIANGIFPDRYGRYKDQSWQALGERLKAALSEEEYAQARRTTQYAHYTSEGVIRSIYAGLQRLGFAGGTMVEPGMGVGHFAGLMPDAIAANSRYTGIEYEPITGAIAKLLYPASNVVVGDYTRTALPRDFFDAAIGNPPFSQTVIANDQEYKARRPMLHDYFFMKAIDRVKPGGLLVFVTSKGTMDKTSDKSRKYLSERANLLGAIRLPQTAFKDNAGTEVVTDVIFLQKRGDGIADNGVKWLDTKAIATPEGPATINEYFADHPEMVLGRHSLQGSMYRANEYTVLPPDGDIESLFAKAVEALPENVTRPARGSLAERAVVQERDFNPKHKKEGGLYLSDDGKLMQVESGSGVEITHRPGTDGKPIALTPKQKKWLRDYVGVRDALKQAQYDQLTDGAWEKSLAALNAAYDAFAKEHGPILDYTTIERTKPETGETTETKRYKNEPLLRLDVEGALAYALENVREDGSIVKGAALTGRVLNRPAEPEVKTTQDALFVSLNRHGSLNLDDVAALAGTDRDSVIRDLGNAVYDAPGQGWQLADEYLSGNVVKKLRQAQSAAEIDPKYKRNVDALLAVQPRPLGPTEITVRLGANWVPASDIQNFAKDVLGLDADVTYNPVLGNWSIDVSRADVTEFGFDKMGAGQILDSVLNARQLKVTYRDAEGKTYTDIEATEKANDIAGKMRERFRSWIWQDTARADRLVKYYNEHFNNIAPRAFDGQHLTLPGVSSRFKLYPHQKRAVWRVIQQGDTYLAHAVGAGKTMEMIAAGMEERRLGLVKKPMYVVPNHMLAQFSREFLELYPAANIMVADEHNFHAMNRKRFVAQAALNNPDAIVITHSAFGRIAMSDDYSAKFIQDQIDAWKEALDDSKGDRITVKQIERRIEQLERRLEGKQGKEKKDKVLDFEELGVDKLYVDEFHEFRKLDFATNQGNIKGIDPNGSQRALDLYMKVQYLREKNPGRALVAASGTPVTNTMGELFTAQRFFQPQQLAEDGMDTFDAWSAQYGDVVTGFEQNAAGGYEMVSRFAKFQNVPELMRRVRSFMDILTSSNLGALVQRPDVVGGGRDVVITPAPDGYKEYQQELQRRIQAIKSRRGPPKKGEDIILNVIGDGRFSAIDMRFVDPSRPSDPASKLNVWIDDLIKAYRDTADYEYVDRASGKPDPVKGASIIGFSDIGLGEASAANRGFDMRGWIEQRLREAGIPAEHIAFMRDYKQHAKKERLFADMREGKKRILIGGKEMETGTNVQKRLTHLFHLDAPWFPASVEQREGRIVRQGNQNKAVTIKAYATKGSYDSTMWGMNARKARFIEQAMNGDDSVRAMDDVSEASAFEMAAALASGDERYMTLAGLKADVEKLERLRAAHYDEQNALRRQRHWEESAIERNSTRAEELKKAIGKRVPIVAGSFEGSVGKSRFDAREAFSTALFDAFKALADNNTVAIRPVGKIGGFDIVFHGVEMKGSGEYVASLHLDLPGDPDPLVTFPIDPGMAVAGIATRAANQVNGLDKDLATAQARVEDAQRKVKQIADRLGAAFPEEAILLEKVAELNALQDELAAENKEASADAAAATVETESADKPAGDEAAAYSVAAQRDPAELEAIFAGLEARGLARQRAVAALNSDPDAAIIRYIDSNFFDILGELDDSGKVNIVC